MKTLLLFWLIVLPSCALQPHPALAHAPMENTITMTDDAFGKKCFTHAVRAAWGAAAQQRGAPLKFKFVPYDDITRYFDSVGSAGGDITPTDAIYVAQDMRLDDAIRYQGSASLGYAIAQLWNEDTRPEDFERSVARFFAACVNPK